MGIFDEEEHMDDIDKRTLINKPRIDSIRFKFEDRVNLRSEIYEEYCKSLSKVDIFHRDAIPGIPDFGEIRKDVKVIFSKLQPTYAEKYKNRSLSKILVLGEYVDSENAIYIYVNNIEAKCNTAPINRLMLAVYIHELYHAYFKSGNRYIREIEEPLAEFGALFCLEAMTVMRTAEIDDLHFYKKMVAEKKKYLPEYAFGEYIHTQHMMRNDWKMGELIEYYRDSVINAKPVSSIESDKVSKWDEAYKKLCTALNYVD